VDSEKSASLRLEISPEGALLAGIKTEKVTRQPVREILQTSGWLVAKPGSQVVVRAPLAGFVMPPNSAAVWSLGQTCVKDATLGVLRAFLSPQEQARMVAVKEDTDTAIKQSAATLRIARQQLARLEQGAAEAVRGTRIQQLQETVARAETQHREALEKLPFLPREPYGETAELRPVLVRAPIDGRLIELHVAARQLVLPGDPLWTVADWSSLWVRIPVFADDLNRVDLAANITLTVPGSNKPRPARPLPVAQPTQPNRQTVDLYAEVDNTGGDLRPGQAVAVGVSAGPKVARWTIPDSALLWDGLGNAWVYVRSASPAGGFQRRAVELGPPRPGRAVVLRGLGARDEVVIVGAEALYGEEFKNEISTEDD